MSWAVNRWSLLHKGDRLQRWIVTIPSFDQWLVTIETVGPMVVGAKTIVKPLRPMVKTIVTISSFDQCLVTIENLWKTIVQLHRDENQWPFHRAQKLCKQLIFGCHKWTDLCYSGLKLNWNRKHHKLIPKRIRLTLKF